MIVGTALCGRPKQKKAIKMIAFVAARTGIEPVLQE